jgi:hypothetical protein
VDAGEAQPLDYGMFLDMIGDGDGDDDEMPLLGTLASDDCSGASSEEARLQQQQDKEVRANIVGL